MLGELGVVSEGVGYTVRFQLFAAGWIDPKAVADKLNMLELPGVLFPAIIFNPFYGKFKEQELHGVQVHIAPGSTVNLMSIQFLFIAGQQRTVSGEEPVSLADPGRLRSFDRVAGSDSVRLLFTQRMMYEDVKPFIGEGPEPVQGKSKKVHALLKAGRGERCVSGHASVSWPGNCVPGSVYLPS